MLSHWFLLFVSCTGVHSGQCRAMWSRPEDHPGAAAPLSPNLSFLHPQRCTGSTCLPLPRRGDVFAPRHSWCHFHAAYKGLPKDLRCGTCGGTYTQSLIQLDSLVRSLTCTSGWTKLIPCFRRELVCWSWSTARFVSAAKTLSRNSRHLFIFLPNTGLGFCGTIFQTTTVTACGCLWPVRVHLRPNSHIKTQFFDGF